VGLYLQQESTAAGAGSLREDPADLRGLSLEREDGGREGAEAELQTRAAAAGVRP